MILVSAIMPTRGRREMAREAVECWKAQIWTRKELIILDDADDPSFPDGIDEPGVCLLTAKERYAIGKKRNICCVAAMGDVVIHFDSDDLSDPSRIADQVATLGELAVTGYHSLKFTDGTQWWKYHGTPGWAFDASLCYRKSFWADHPFAEVNDGCEAPLRQAAIQARQFISTDSGDLLTVRNHAGNTDTRTMIGDCWERL